MHEVFISYSSKDTVTANAVCHILEDSGIRCFIAPRDIAPGALWAEAIVDAIRDSRVFVLVFSRNSNQSKQVHKEIGIAVGTGLTVIPFITSNDKPYGALEYYMADTHWIDALAPPLEAHIHRLANRISTLLDFSENTEQSDNTILKDANADNKEYIGEGDAPLTKKPQSICMCCGYHHDLSHCPICSKPVIDGHKHTRRQKAWKVLSLCIWLLLVVVSCYFCVYYFQKGNDFLWQENIVFGIAYITLLVFLLFAYTFFSRLIRIRKYARTSGQGSTDTLRRKYLILYRRAFFTGSTLIILYLTSIVIGFITIYWL